MKRTRIVVVDDFSGEEIPDGEVCNRHLSVDGISFELDLSARSSQALDAALLPFLRHLQTSTGAALPVESSSEQKPEDAALTTLVEAVTEAHRVYVDKTPEPVEWWGERVDAAPEAGHEVGHEVGADPEPAPVEQPSEQPAEEWISTHDAAEILGQLRTNVDRIVRQGHIRADTSKPRRLLLADVEKYRDNPPKGGGPRPKRRTPERQQRQGARLPGGLRFDPPGREEGLELPAEEPDVEPLPKPAPPPIKRTELPPVLPKAGKKHKRRAAPRWDPAEAERELAISLGEIDPGDLRPVVMPTPRPPAGEVVRPQHLIEPGINVVRADDREDHRVRRETSPAWSTDPAPKWASVEALEESAVKLRERLRDGLPETIRFTYHPEVLGVEGMDFDIVETALRHPERVMVAPETFAKEYPILRFHKGDCTTVLGMRDPAQPAIIAAYHGSLLENDRHRVNHEGGGGGRQRQEGLPRTPAQLVSRLAGHGVKVEWDKGSLENTAPALYKGEDLGKVTVGPRANRVQVENDYQRIVRKVDGINRKAAAVG